MARGTYTATNYLGLTSAILSGTPISFACWFNKNDTGTVGSLMSISDSTSSDNYFVLQARLDAKLWASTKDTSQSEAKSGANYLANVWEHGGAVYDSPTDRRVFLNGVKNTNTTSVTPGSMDRTNLGALVRSSVVIALNGDLAECAIWNVSLTDDEMASLAGGVPPTRVQPASMVAYYPLFASNTGGPVDYSGDGNTMTETGTVGVADPPPVSPQFSFGRGWEGELAAAAITVPEILSTMAIGVNQPYITKPELVSY